MKEAAGEANMTVITIILIAVVAAIATPLVKSMMDRSKISACCAEAGLPYEAGICQGGEGNATYETCIGK